MKQLLTIILLLITISSANAEKDFTVGIGLNFPASIENVGYIISGTLGDNIGLYAHVRSHTYQEHIIFGGGLFFGFDKDLAFYFAPWIIGVCK